MPKLVCALVCSKSGASSAEYAMIIGVLASFVIAGALIFGNSINESMVESAVVIDDAETTVPDTP